METGSIAALSGVVALFVSALGVVTNFILNSRRERRHANLQDVKIELEAFNAVRAEAEIIRKELRTTIQEQSKEIVILEKENARLDKELHGLEKENERMQREYDSLKKEHDKLAVANELLRKDLDDLRRRFPYDRPSGEH